jgi:hypothetical protein
VSDFTIFPNKVSAHVADLRRQGAGVCRVNHLITAAKGFTRWLYRNGRLATFESIERGRVKPREEWTVAPGKREPLVEPNIFERAQVFLRSSVQSKSR